MSFSEVFLTLTVRDKVMVFAQLPATLFTTRINLVDCSMWHCWICKWLVKFGLQLLVKVILLCTLAE